MLEVFQIVAISTTVKHQAQIKMDSLSIKMESIHKFNSLIKEACQIIRLLVTKGKLLHLLIF